MASYTAEIRLGVTGQRELEQARSSISKVNEAIDSLNKNRLNVGGLTQSLSAFEAQLSRAARGLADVQLGSEKTTGALQNYLKALGTTNTAQANRSKLINDQIRDLQGLQTQEERNIEVLKRLNAIQSGRYKQEQEAKDVQQLGQAKQDELQLQQGLLRLEQKSAEVLNYKLELQEKLNGLALRQGVKDVSTVSTETAKRQQVLAGKSGTVMQGPLAGPGAMGFRVALPLNKLEQQGLETETKKQQILQRMVATRQELGGLAANLQRLDTNSVVAIADANRYLIAQNVQRKRALDLAKAQVQGPGSPGGERAFRQASEKQAAEQKAARAQRMESIALGVGFPLMFGAGPGSVAGSLAGSLVGSGFGGQILGGALGQTLDDAAKSAADFARSMREGGDAAGYLTEKLGYLNPETKALIQNAQQSGQTAKAAALAQQELANVIGGSAAADLKNYGELWDFTGRQFQKFTLLLQAGMPQIIAQTVAAATGLTGLYAVVSKLPVVAGLAGMVAPKEKPETVEAQTKTKELKEQLAVAKANYQVSLQNNTANSQGYLISKAQTIQTEKTVKYNEIIRDLEIKKISEKDKITKILALELNTTQQLRDLDKERVQILDQRNQVVLAQQQATQQVSLIQQQVQLAREQNTASEVRKTSLQGQISIQQALNAQESISLQLNQELNKQQRDRNENKIKELQAQRSIATANIELAQQQAAQQQQQSLRNVQVSMYETTKQRLSLERDIRSVLEQHLEITGTSSEFYIAQNKNIKENYSVSKGILDLETNIALLQNPSLTEEINSAYQQRLTLLKREYELQVAIQKLRIQTAIAERSKLLVGGDLEARINQNELQNTLSTAQLGISMQGRPQAEVEKAQLLLNIQKEREQRQLQFAKGITALEADIYASSGLTRENLQIQYEQRLKNYEAENLLYNQIDAVRIKQQELNGFASTYGSLIQGIGGSIESGLVGAIDSAITGARSLQEVLSDVLKDIGKMLISFGIRSLLSGININGAPLVGRAAGGPVSSNSTYMVGEKGPELFVPNTSGTIVPADATAAAMARYQRQGGSSDNELDPAAAMARYQRQDGNFVGMGGNRNTTNSANNTTNNGYNTAGNNTTNNGYNTNGSNTTNNEYDSNSDTVNNIQTSPSPVLAFSFETTRFLGQDYVSTDQLQAAMKATEKRATAAGAKAGAAQVSSQMRNSPAYRRQVGLR